MIKIKSLFVAMMLTLPVATFAQTEATDNDDEFDVTFDTQTTNTSPKISNRKDNTTTQTTTLIEVDEFGDTIVKPEVIDVNQPAAAPLNITTTVADAMAAAGDDVMPAELAAAMDSLMTLYNNQTYLAIDEDCNFPNYNPTYDDETYMQRLQKLPTILEMPYNSVVRQMIDRYTARNRHAVSVMLATQNFYMPIFEQALETYGLPLELKYLPIIESGLNPKAVSRMGATGLWQFMLGTAKQYGLEVTSLVDERCDPVKSSYAAAKYLSDMYKIFGDWSLVIAAYNCGPSNVTKAIHRAGNVYDYWKIYPYLPKETRGYVPAFIAANYVMTYYCEHNICPMLSRLPEQTDTVMVSRDIHFDQISQVLGVPMSQLQELNPQYRKNLVNGSSRPSILRLPTQQALAFAEKEDEIFNYNSAVYRPKRATVEPGYDGESTAATQPAPSPSAVGVSDPLIESKAQAAAQPQPSRNSQSASNQSSNAQRRSKSNSQSASAQQSKTSKKTTAKDNDSRNSRNSKNSKSKQDPKKDSKKGSSKGSSEHTIKKGESLSVIARKNGTTVEKLKKLNPKIKGDRIREGDKLKVK